LREGIGLVMSTTTGKLFLLLGASSLFLSPLAGGALSAQERVEVGNAASVVGDVTLQAGGKGKKKDVERKDRVAWGDLIATGKKSQLQILLLDRSTFGMCALAQLRVDRFVYDPNEGRSLFATFIKGALRFFSGREDERNSAEIGTPAGRIGIRGTAVDLLVGKNAEEIAEKEEAVGKVASNKDEATLVILRGPGPATDGGLIPGIVDVEGAGETVTLDSPGLAAYIPRAGAAPIGPFRISNGGLANVQDELAPEVARAAKGGNFLEKLIPFAVGAIAIGTILDGDSGSQSRTTGTSPNGATLQRSPTNGQTSSVPPPKPQ